MMEEYTKKVIEPSVTKKVKEDGNCRLFYFSLNQETLCTHLRMPTIARCQRAIESR